MSACCEPEPETSCCGSSKKNGPDFLLWSSLALCGWTFGSPRLGQFTSSTSLLLAEMWWGLTLGIITLLAAAPGNAFTFLMVGAATDYTEIMALKETTRSWKISLFLPLLTVPQILVISWLMNMN